MAIRVLLYCLKVWISALLIGTILFVLLSYAFSQTTLDRGELRFAGWFLVYGSGFSIPSLLIAWLASFYIIRGSRSGRAKRFWIAVLAVPLTLLPFIIFDQGRASLDWKSICLIAGLYYLVTAAGIFFFPLPAHD
jgi:amino acid permease